MSKKLEITMMKRNLRPWVRNSIREKNSTRLPKTSTITQPSLALRKSKTRWQSKTKF